jgi:hypothetical protein
VKLCERHLVSGNTSGISDGLKKAADKLSTTSKKARITAAAVTGTVVLAGALTAVGVSAHNDSVHKKQAATQALNLRLASEKAASDQAAEEKAAADKAVADKAAADAAAAQKAAADKAAADKAAADKAAADKLAAQRAAAAAQVNRDAQRPPITQTPSTPVPSKSPSTSPAPAASYGSPQAIAQGIVPAGQFSCFSTIISRESGWNVHATNPSSGAYGLPQALPGSKMASAGPDWQNNPATQIKWALSYMDSRYGSPCGALSFWNGHGWY